VVSAPAPDGRGRQTAPRDRRRVESRAKLLQAAKAVFEEKGFLAVRVSDIAERAGVSHGLFYHYFESKHDAFRELATAIDQELIDTMDIVADRASTATLPQRLEQSIRLNFERYRRDARVIAGIADVSRYDEDISVARRALRRASRERLIEGIRELQRHGLADAHIDASITATGLEAMAYGFAERWFVDGDVDFDFDDGVSQFTLLVMNILGCNERVLDVLA